MSAVSWWAGLLVEVIDELWRPQTPAQRRAGLERSMAVDRERLIREIEVSEGRRSSVWGSQR